MVPKTLYEKLVEKEWGVGVYLAVCGKLHYWAQCSLLLHQPFCPDLIICGVYFLSLDIELKHVTYPMNNRHNDASFMPGPQRCHMFLLAVSPLPLH